MGRKANPAVIGGFVVGAIVLAVAGLLVFGSGKMFKHTVKFVCYFPGAVDGLNVGAPVRFKGVEVGSVTDIRLRLGQTGGAKMIDAEAVARGIRIPVTIEIDADKVASQGARRDLRDQLVMKNLIELGLRAQLNSQSLVTGLLFVQLDFRPGTPIQLVGPPDSTLMEIPTLQTTMEQVQSAAAEIIHKLEDMHFENLVKSAAGAVDAVKDVVGAPEFKQTIEALPTTVANVNQAVASLRELTTRLDGKTGPLLDSLTATSNKTEVTVEQARSTLQSVQTFVDANSALSSQLTGSLQEVSGAARSLRLLADYLERNPSALVRGKDVSVQ